MKKPLEPSVRRATAADASALASFRYDFRSSLGNPIETRTDFVQRCVSWMRVHLEDDGHWRAWIAERDGTAIGTVWLQIIEKLPNPVVERELHAYVTNLFVLPEHRAQGTGGLLLSALLTECHALEVDTILLWPTAESRTLYQRHGFAVTDAVMSRVL